MTRSGAKLLLLLWKNWKLQVRHPIQGVVEILVPVLFSAIILGMRGLVIPENISEVTSFESYDPLWVFNFSTATNRSKIPEKIYIAWSPKDNSSISFRNQVDEVMHRSIVGLPLSLLDFESEAEMERNVTQEGHTHLQESSPDDQYDSYIVWAGIVLQDAGSLDEPQLCSENLKLKIRFPGELRTTQVPGRISPFKNWHTNLLYPLFIKPGPRDADWKYGPDPPYAMEGFAAIQSLVSRAIASYCWEEKVGSSLSERDVNSTEKAQAEAVGAAVKLRRFSFPPYIDDPILTALESAVPMMIMLGFVYTCIVTVKVVTTEKETQVKEAMKIMGLPTLLHWTAWFIKTIVMLAASAALITVLFKADVGGGVAVLTHCSGFVLFFFLLVYMLTITFFCFMVSVFFSKANTAATIGALVWFIAYMPYSIMSIEYETLSLTEKILSCLSFNSAMGFGFRVMVTYEGTGEGQQFSNIWKSASQDDTLVLGHIFMVMLLDCVIYFIITLYVEAVFPGDFGVPKPWYFLFQKSFWCRSKQVWGSSSDSTDGQNNENFEPEPTRARAGVQIRNLRKVFNGDKVAVDNLNLNMYEGQITVLLGHNGAGKTTTMSMLTGMYTPTSGRALVNGCDVATDAEGARDSLGLCPQHNVLFDEMTVREHLYFFGKLKGLSGKELEDEIQKYVKLLQLEDKEHKQSRTLSGGMKRKLAAGVALCGKSKVVMFDEPTSGMDPAARRALWDLLREEKAGRTLLLTTHFMDEADLLGDRIAIMAGGRLQCCGSPFFLKKRYGAGYRLVLVKGARCSAAAVTALLARHAPALRPAHDVGSELSFQLDGALAPRFERMLRDLEAQRAALDVLSYGVSLTTMEEVFMKVGKDNEVLTDDGHFQYSQESLDTLVSVDVLPSAALSPKTSTLSEVSLENMAHNKKNSSAQLQKGPKLLMNQLHAMLMKKGLALARNWVLVLVHFLLPIIFIILAIVIGKMYEIVRTLPPREIQLQSYSDTETIVAIDEAVNPIIKNLSSNYVYQVEKISKVTQIPGSESEFEECMLDEYRKDVSLAQRKYIVGASFKGTSNLSSLNIVGWFNDKPYHAVPLALNLLYNSILNETGVFLDVVNHPLPYTAESQATLLEYGNNLGFQIAFNFGFSMAFVTAYYILFTVKERVSKAKHLQFVSGVNVVVFWGVHLVCDGLFFVIPSLGVVLTLAAFQEDGFSTFEELGRVFLVLICFGWSVLPMTYLASFFFDIPASGYTKLSIFSIFVGNAGMILVQSLKMPGIDLINAANIVQWILIFIPQYAMVDAISSLNSYYMFVEICSSFKPDCSTANFCCPDNCPNTGCVSSPPTYFQFTQPGIGRHIVFMICSGCLFNIILLLIEFHFLDWLKPSQDRSKKSKSDKNVALGQGKDLFSDLEDTDVLQEKENIRSSRIQELTSNFSLVLKDVTKYYGKFLAVNKISIGVKRGECFGLLGVNGAGKTTTFKMMTGDERISAGDAFLEGLNLKGDIKMVHKLIGYCPQFDALIEEMTGRETLRMFCLLRGIPKDDISRITSELADELLFTKHLDKKVKEYSGGNKRKLSTAVALVGDPPIVFLDEPTTGMDPVAKRHLWNVICKVRDRGKSIILTSHSMEECEALCTRLVIMVNGAFKCLGSTQHLKNKFAQGYTLIIKVASPVPSSPLSRTFSISSVNSLPDVNGVKHFVENSFPGAVLREEFLGLLTYYIPNTNFTWSQMFGMMERAKEELNIEDYSLGQTSLEQVFLSFTRAQKEQTTEL